MIYCIFIFTTVKYIKLNKSFCLKKQNRSCLSNSLKEKQSCLICMVPWKKFRQIDETLLRGHQKSSENVIGISIYNLKMALSPSQTPKTFFTMKWARAKGNVPASWVQKARALPLHIKWFYQTRRRERSQRAQTARRTICQIYDLPRQKCSLAVLSVYMGNVELVFYACTST